MKLWITEKRFAFDPEQDKKLMEDQRGKEQTSEKWIAALEPVMKACRMKYEIVVSVSYWGGYMCVACAPTTSAFL